MKLKQPLAPSAASSILLLVVATLALKTNSIHAEQQQQQQLRRQQRRTLQGGLSTKMIPFGATVKIGKGSSNSNKQPKSTDYEGVADAIMNWFDDNSQQAYSGNNDLNFLDTECSVESASSLPDDSNFHHEISLTCTAKFEYDNTSTNNDGPSNLEVIQKAATYNVNNFVQDYLNPAVTAGSAFQQARRISLGMVYMSSSPSPGSGSGNNPAAPHPVPTPANQAPVPSPSPPPNPSPVVQPTTSPAPVVVVAPTNGQPPHVAMPIPTGPPPHVGPPTSTNTLVYNPIILQWSLGRPANNNVPLRAPTTEEWDQLSMDVKDFIFASFDRVYNTIDVNNILPEFVALQDVSVESKTYDASNNDKPYEMTVKMTAVFELTEGTTRPPMFQWVTILQLEGLNKFRTDFLSNRDGSIFQNPSSLQWRALDP